MFLGDRFQKSVVFIGLEDPKSPSGFNCSGTGFLIAHDDMPYIVTARHVMTGLKGKDLVVRVNRGGQAVLIKATDIKWYTPEDDTVDLALSPFGFRKDSGFDALQMPTDIFLDDDSDDRGNIGVGSQCYTVGLFHFIHGTKQNVPFVYSGNIAAILPKGELVPVHDPFWGATVQTEAHLIECRALRGASGSPVYVRPEMTVFGVKDDLGGTNNVSWPQAKVHLFGLFVGSWSLPPSEELKGEIPKNGNLTVPAGVGVVVPAEKIIQLLEQTDVREAREKKELSVAKIIEVKKQR